MVVPQHADEELKERRLVPREEGVKGPALAALLVLVLLAVPSAAQTGGAVVTGKVIDETGAALPGAVVTLSGPAGTKSTTTASTRGSARSSGRARS